MVAEGHRPLACVECVMGCSCTVQQQKEFDPKASAKKHGLHYIEHFLQKVSLKYNLSIYI